MIDLSGSINKFRRQEKRHCMIDISNRKKKFQVGDLVLLYNNKFMQHIGKFRMNWLGPYVIQHVMEVVLDY
jgi:hypothetical protein